MEAERMTSGNSNEQINIRSEFLKVLADINGTLANGFKDVSMTLDNRLGGITKTLETELSGIKNVLVKILENMEKRNY